MSDCKKEKESSKEPSTAIQLKSKKKIWLKLLWFLFCSSGCIVHTHLVTQAYRKHQVISATEQEYLKIVKPPAISMCFQFVDIFNVNLKEAQNEPWEEMDSILRDKANKRLRETEFEFLEETTTAPPDSGPVFVDLTINDTQPDPHHRPSDGNETDANNWIDISSFARKNAVPERPAFVQPVERVNKDTHDKSRDCMKKVKPKPKHGKNSQGRQKRSMEDSEEFEDPRWLEEYSTEELVYPLHQVVVNVAIRDPIALRTTLVDLQKWTAFVNESVYVYELPVRDLVCYQIPLAKLIVQSYNATSFKNLATPFVKFDVTQVNYLEFIELYIHDENVRPRAQDHRIVLYPKTTYTLGYKEHLYLYDDFFRGRPCKEYTSFREDEIADCLVNGDPEEMCIDELNDAYCSVTYFRPVLSKRDKQRNYAVQVGLLLGTERSKTTMIPKTTLSEYVTLVTGIIGFWFGVNLITFHGLSKNVIKTIQREPDQPMVMLELS